MEASSGSFGVGWPGRRHCAKLRALNVPYATSPKVSRISSAKSTDPGAAQQSRDQLSKIWKLVESRRTTRYTSLVVPSLSFDVDELAKIRGISFYEERLLFTLIRLRDPRARVIYVTSQPIHPEIID